MISIRKSGVTALTAAIALSLGAVPVALTVPSIVASEEGPTTLTPASVATGSQIKLTTNSAQGQVTGNGKTQVFTGGKQCAVTALDSVNLLEITGSIGLKEDGNVQSGTPGFRDGDIGVYEVGAVAGDPNNASQCFRVDSGSFTDEESLEVALGDDTGYNDAPFGTLLAGSASVGIYAKTQSGQVKVDLLDEVGGVISTLPLKDTAWTKTKLGNKIDLASLSAISVGQAFDGVRLTAKAGSFSLREATFNLVSQADFNMNCTDKNTFSKETVTVTYTGTADGTACNSFGITLDNEAATSTEKEKFIFHKPLTVDPDAQFVFTMPWDVQTATTVNDLPAASMNFEIPGQNPVIWHEMDFCPDYLFVDGLLKGLFPPIKLDGSIDTTAATYKTYQANYELLKSLDKENGTPGIQFACIGGRDPVFTKATAGFNLQVTDQIYLIGDAQARF